MIRIKLITLSLLAALLFSCATTTPLSDKKKEGIDYIIEEIDLEDPELSIITYPKTSGYVKPMEVSRFAEKTKCFAAINANPFSQKNPVNPFSMARGIGIYVDEGKCILQPTEKYAALAFFRTEHGFKANVSSSQAALLSENPDYAVGGFWVILEGEKIYNFRDIKDFRSAAGISQDGTKLYLFAAKNMNYMECAHVMKSHGVYKALQLDGGSSSQLCIRGKKFQNLLIPRNPAVILGFKNNSSSKN